MDGFRFWRTGFWKDHLRGKPYHISALYVIDLVRFRCNPLLSPVLTPLNPEGPPAGQAAPHLGAAVLPAIDLPVRFSGSHMGEGSRTLAPSKWQSAGKWQQQPPAPNLQRQCSENAK